MLTVAVVVAVNNTGNALSPMFIFPRKMFRESFFRDGLTGYDGIRNKS
jgi:hypothetical protein